MQSRHLGALLLLGALWGASFLFIKLGVAEMTPEVLVSIRLGVAALILLAVLYGRGGRLPPRGRVWWDFLFTGLFGLVFPHMLITWGEQSIPSGMTAILNATTPLFTVLLTYVWTREEQLSGLKLAGAALGFVGVVVAVGVAELSLSSASTLGYLAVLLAAFCYGVSGIYGRRAFRGMSAMVPATGQLLAGALVIIPIALVTSGVPSPLPSATALGAVLALAILGTAMAYILLYWLMERIGATRTSLVTYLLPPFALVYGVLFLNEQITIEAILGLLLVICGIVLANGMPRRRAAPELAAPELGEKTL